MSCRSTGKMNEEEHLAYEIVKALEWEDLLRPVDGIEKILPILRRHGFKKAEKAEWEK